MNKTRLYEVFKDNYFYDYDNIDVDNIEYDDENYDIYVEARDNLLKDIYELIVDYMLDNKGKDDTVSKNINVVSNLDNLMVEGSLYSKIVHTKDWEDIKNNCIKALKEADIGDYLCEVLVDVISECFDF